MKIERILREGFHKTVVYLVEESRDRIFMLVFQLNPGTLPERHLEITVQPPVRHHRDRQRIDHAGSSEPAAEEIPKWYLHRRKCLIIPVKAEHQIPQDKTVCICRFVRHGDPDVPNDAGTFNCRKIHPRAGRDIMQAGCPLPGRSKPASRHAAPALLSGWVFCIDRPAFHMLIQKQVSE